MYKDYKIKAFIPACRKQYMELLIPQLIKLEFLDEIMILKNTMVKEDCDYIDSLKSLDKVQVYEVKTKSNQWKHRVIEISKFYANLIKPQTIYIKFDDDLIYIHKDAIQNLLDYRIQHKEYFIVYPLIINNAYCLWRLFKNNKCTMYPELQKINKYNTANDDFLYNSHKMAFDLHKFFLNKLETNTVDDLIFDNEEIENARVSINCICWFGECMFDCANHISKLDDEEYISRTYPNKHKLKNALVGNAIVSHFAFTPQRNGMTLEQQNELLENYKKFIN